MYHHSCSLLCRLGSPKRVGVALGHTFRPEALYLLHTSAELTVTTTNLRLVVTRNNFKIFFLGVKRHCESVHTTGVVFKFLVKVDCLISVASTTNQEQMSIVCDTGIPLEKVGAGRPTPLCIGGPKHNVGRACRRRTVENEVTVT